MQHTLSILKFQTEGPGLYEVTDHVGVWLSGTEIARGILTLFCQHTSAGLLITENASPAVRSDLVRWFDAAAPEGPGYAHAVEGPDDMPAHIKTMLTATSLHIPVLDGELALGTWQAIYLIEHRSAPHRREVVMQFVGSTK